MFLSDEEIDSLTVGNNYPGTVPGARRFARNVILAYRAKIENSPMGWIQTDHLVQAQKAPFLCRVSPEKLGDWMTPIYAYPF